MNEFDDVLLTIPKWKMQPVSQGRRLEKVTAFCVAILCVTALIMLLAGCAGNPGYAMGDGISIAAEKAAPVAVIPEDRLGIRMEGLRLSAAGYILDLRYRVLDPARAAPLLDKKIRPYLLDGASGAQLGVPDTAKLGQLRTTGRNKVVPDQDYFILFANPGRFVQPGARMTLVMGDVRIENLVVQ